MSDFEDIWNPSDPGENAQSSGFPQQAPSTHPQTAADDTQKFYTTAYQKTNYSPSLQSNYTGQQPPTYDQPPAYQQPTTPQQPLIPPYAPTQYEMHAHPEKSPSYRGLITILCILSCLLIAGIIFLGVLFFTHRTENIPAKDTATSGAAESSRDHTKDDQESDSHEDSDKDKNKKTPPTTPPAPAPSETPAPSEKIVDWPPAGLTKNCTSNIGVNDVTTCQFAEAVEQAYRSHGEGLVTDIYSTTTKMYYDMECTAEASNLTICRGGNNAEVYIKTK